MGLLEEIFVKAKGAANNLGAKAGKTVDVYKLSIELSEVKTQMKAKFENIGKAVYNSMKSGDSIVESRALEGEIKEIDELYCKIEALEKEIAILKDKTICKACGAVNPSDGLYCNKCGHTLEIRCTCNSDSDNSCNHKEKSDCGCLESSSDCDCYPECSCSLNSSDEDDD